MGSGLISVAIRLDMFSNNFMEYELLLDCYQGPLHKLLELVEDKKLDITLVSLAQVTDDFIRYVRALEAREETHYDLIANFLVVASQLVLIKSKMLLPTLVFDSDEEESLHDLEHRLQLYQELKATRNFFEERWADLPRMYARPFLRLSKPIFYPHPGITLSSLQTVFLSVIDVFERQFIKTEAIEREVVQLEAKIEFLLERIRISKCTFSECTSQASRQELVVLFLALLHLVKEERVMVRQEDNLGEIILEATS